MELCLLPSEGGGNLKMEVKTVILPIAAACKVRDNE